MNETYGITIDQQIQVASYYGLKHNEQQETCRHIVMGVSNCNKIYKYKVDTLIVEGKLPFGDVQEAYSPKTIIYVGGPNNNYPIDLYNQLCALSYPPSFDMFGIVYCISRARLTNFTGVDITKKEWKLLKALKWRIKYRRMWRTY